jgi:hypothetical protein
MPMELKHLLTFLRSAEAIQLDYMVTGSIAAILYGKPRLTEDMDVVIVLPKEKVRAFAGLFDAKAYYCPPVETIEEELARARGGHFNIIDQATGFKVDLYPAGSDPLARWGLAHRKRIELIADEAVWVAPPEYVIVMKLVYYEEGGSQKHLDDIAGMLAVSAGHIDIPVIEGWVERLGLEECWSEARRGPKLEPTSRHD